jgi:hypothetical protein
VLPGKATSPTLNRRAPGALVRKRERSEAGAATRAIEAGAGSMRLRVAMQKWGMEKSRSSGDMQDDRLIERRA